MAATQFLCFGEYLLYKSGNTYSINSCETIEVFYDIRTDLDKLKYAAHITKIINDVTTENQNTYRVLQLYLNTLYMISETSKNLSLINSVFTVRLLSIIGFRPNIDECTNCKDKNNLMYFSFKDSGFKCLECSKQDKGSIEITETTNKTLLECLIKFIKKAKKLCILAIKKTQILTRL